MKSQSNLSNEKNILMARSFFKSLVLFFFIVTSQLFSASYPLINYLDLLKEHPLLGPAGSHREGEIEIVTDPDEIRRIENDCYENYLKKGMDSCTARQASQAGIISQDPFWIVLRDAVIFPNGSKGLFNRVIEKNSLDQTFGSTVIAPLLPDGRIILVLNYRHATRRWEIELARGSHNANETPEQTAIRQTSEETGYKLQKPQILGYLNTNSTLSSCNTAVVAGFVQERRSPQLDNSEAIKGILALTKKQLLEALQKGWFEMGLNGKLQKIHVRDPYIAYVILMAENRGIWP
jgi:ADP-ribose pyrophosphatase